MKITHLRLRKLVSGPGYEHHACEIEARIEDGDDLETVSALLRAEIDRQLRISRNERQLVDRRDHLRNQVATFGRLRDALSQDIEANRKIIKEHEQLRELAIKHGIDAVGLNLEIPF